MSAVHCRGQGLPGSKMMAADYYSETAHTPHIKWPEPQCKKLSEQQQCGSRVVRIACVPWRSRRRSYRADIYSASTRRRGEPAYGCRFSRLPFQPPYPGAMAGYDVMSSHPLLLRQSVMATTKIGQCQSLSSRDKNNARRQK